MTYANFIPEIWSRSILQASESALVFGSVVNRDYEGEITAGGDTVRINSIGDPTVRTYDRASAITAAEQLSNSQQSLVIDQEEYVNFKVSDIDQVQANAGLVAEGTRRTGYVLAKSVDAFLATTLEAGTAAGNTLSDASISASASSDDAYELLVDLSVALDEADVPDSDRWCIVSPAFHGLMLRDPRFVSYGTDKNGNTLANGKIGAAAGFTLYKSNQVVVDASSHPTIQAGHPSAATFVQQLIKTEAYRIELGFDDAVKTLNVYGAKVTRPDHLAKVEVTIS
jgi:N4-gp56 family major capsid protein